MIYLFFIDISDSAIITLICLNQSLKPKTDRKEMYVPKAKSCKDVIHQQVLYLNVTNVVQGVLSQG